MMSSGRSQRPRPTPTTNAIQSRMPRPPVSGSDPPSSTSASCRDAGVRRTCIPSDTPASRQEADVLDGGSDPETGGRGMRDWMAFVVGVGRGLWLLPLDIMFRTVGLRYGWLKALFQRTPPRILAGLGQLRAERAAWRAVRNVPAYRRLLQDAGVRGRSLFPLGIMGRLPETDKRSYVDRFDLLDRCVGGSVPYVGTTIDESSGSTGTPYNWIRGRSEREVAHRNISFFARYAFGTKPLVTINAFSMGAWATGFNMSLGMMRHGIVKSIGPDIDKILSTLSYLGPGYRFLISGYPPFVKYLLDEGDRRGFPWASYEMHALVEEVFHERRISRDEEPV